MSSPRLDPPGPPQRRGRDLTSLSFMVVGAVGLVGAGLALSPLVGAMAASVVLIAVGAALGLDL